MDLPVIYQVAAFVLGLLFGSFLNVCISRLPRGESVVRPRSRCPECGAAIRWYDNLPLVSWMLLRARCRDCHAGVSWRYPAVELAMGCWLVYVLRILWRATHPVAAVAGTVLSLPGAGQMAESLLAAVGIAILGFLLLGLIVMDWQTQRLPDAFTLSGILAGFVLVCLRALFLGPTEGDVVLSNHHIQLTSPGSVIDHGNVFLTGPEALIGGWLVGVAGSALLLLLIRWLYQAVRHREGLGLGDVKLLAMMAAFLGFWPATLALSVGVLGATGYAVWLLARGGASGTTRLPLGSFLAAGGLVAAVFGGRILATYVSLLR